MASNTALDQMSEDKSGYIYLLITREFVNSGQSIYKIGRTAQKPYWQRFSQYPKDSIVILSIKVDDHIQTESVIKQKLKQTTGVKQKIEIGEEYFEGNINLIRKICCDICLANDLSVNPSNNANMEIIEEKCHYMDFIDNYMESIKNPYYEIDYAKIYQLTKYWCQNEKKIKCPQKIDIEMYVKKKSDDLKNFIYSDFIDQCLSESEYDSIKFEKTYQLFKMWWEENFGGNLPVRKEMKENLEAELGIYQVGSGWCGYKLNTM